MWACCPHGEAKDSALHGKLLMRTSDGAATALLPLGAAAEASLSLGVLSAAACGRSRDIAPCKSVDVTRWCCCDDASRALALPWAAGCSELTSALPAAPLRSVCAAATFAPLLLCSAACGGECTERSLLMPAASSSDVTRGGVGSSDVAGGAPAGVLLGVAASPTA